MPIAAPELQGIREAIAGRSFARAVDLCELGLNQLPPRDEEEALRALLADARRGLHASLPDRAPPPPECAKGVEALWRGSFEEARRWLRAAIAVAPACAEAHTHLGMALAAAGEFEEAWREYEWRRRIGWGEPRDMIVPYWDGTPLAGRTLLLWDEQGSGDAIQFIRFAGLAARAAQGRVLFHGRPRLCRLFRSCPGIDVAIPRSDDFPTPAAHAGLLSLPAILGAGADAIAGAVPYLAAEPALAETWRRRLAHLPRPRVGLVWQGNPSYAFDGGRSFPLAALAPILRGFADRVAFVSLQKGAGEEQLAQLPHDLAVTNLGPDLDPGDDGFVDTAAVVANLDLVISSDTGSAHLVGALGRPLWLALGANADWRWGEHPTATPFYPTARLFRRGSAEDWAGVFARVGDALAGVVRAEAAA
jgi:hypothetical protein